MLHQLQLRCGHGTFVEFGARNGVEHSNTLYFERALGWRGILIEADPTQYRNLERPRSPYGQPAAVVDLPRCRMHARRRQHDAVLDCGSQEWRLVRHERDDGTDDVPK